MLAKRNHHYLRQRQPLRHDGAGALAGQRHAKRAGIFGNADKGERRLPRQTDLLAAVQGLSEPMSTPLVSGRTRVVRIKQDVRVDDYHGWSPMIRPLDPLEQLTHVVARDSRLQSAEVVCLDRERLLWLRQTLLWEASTQGLVDQRLEGTARPARLGSQPRGDIVFECQCGAHTMMLDTRHHDVKAGTSGV